MTDYIFYTDITISPLGQAIADFIIATCEIPDDRSSLRYFIRCDEKVNDQLATTVWVQHFLNDHPELEDYEFEWLKYYIMMCFEQVAPFVYIGGIPSDFDFSPLVYDQMASTLQY